MKWGHNNKYELYCYRCYNCNAKTTLDTLRYKHLLSGLWEEKEAQDGETKTWRNIAGFHVNELFMHDKDCATLPYKTWQDLYNRRGTPTPDSFGGILKQFEFL